MRDHTTIGYTYLRDGRCFTEESKVFYKDCKTFEDLPLPCQSEEIRKEFEAYKRKNEMNNKFNEPLMFEPKTNQLFNFVNDFNKYIEDHKINIATLEFRSDGMDDYITYKDFPIYFSCDDCSSTLEDYIEEEIDSFYKLLQALKKFKYSVPDSKFIEKYGVVTNE